MAIKDPDLDLLDRLLDLHAPSPEIGKDLDDIRAAFKRLGKLIIKKAPRTPDRTVALRKLHEATMAAIFATVAPREEDPGASSAEVKAAKAATAKKTAKKAAPPAEGPVTLPK